MKLQEYVPLSSLTTFKLGGPARFVAQCENEEDIKTALTLSRERGLPWYVLGGGSNLLAADEGFSGVLLQMRIPGMTFEEQGTDTVHAVVGAGVVWDEFVRAAGAHGLWGIENLAGIPGTVGATPVQNIGAYGTDIAETLLYVEAFDTQTNAIQRFTAAECAFGYRDSRFKRDSSLIILRVAFTLSLAGVPKVSYADLAARIQAGAVLDTPETIAQAVREIRAQKFPDLTVAGTAGSFFKNPVIPEEAFKKIHDAYPELPGYVGEDGVKLSLAWILDKALNLRGFHLGPARLFERQPLVLVTEGEAHASDVAALADEVAARVLAATGISIEREVRSLQYS